MVHPIRLRALSGLLFTAGLLRGSMDPLPERVEFNRHVRPILSENCFACHGPDKNARKAELRLDRRGDALADHEGRRALVPGQPAASELIRRLTLTDPEEVMPPPKTNKHLSERERAIVSKWIEQGGDYEPHWSYVAPRKAGLPAAAPGADAPHPIDRWVLNGLAGKSWSPTPPAPPAVLLRRLFLDLIGLPPSAAEVAAFASATQLAPQSALDEAVNQLLNSPHFGERLAIPWLDLVRYADTVGYHGDQNMTVTPFRDYVIASFNANTPFDRFTREQLAGDLLATGLPEGARRTELLVASGYNRLNSTSEEGGSQPKEYLAKYMTDRVRTTSTTWLATTLGCSQCHDHKFDPLPTRDFYSMGAFFADIEEVGVYGGNGSRPPDMIVPRSEDQARLADLQVLIPQAELALAAAQPADLSAEFAAWIGFLREIVPTAATIVFAPSATLGAIAAIERDPTAVEAKTAAHYRNYAVSLAALRNQLTTLIAERNTLTARGTKTLITRSVAPRPIRILPRGNWMDDSGDVVAPAVPVVFQQPRAEAAPATSLNRLDLANWLVSRDNPLTARVFVNRLWKQFFGTGLSKQLDELGSQGDWPRHQELLDWLAVEFMDSGWDVKHLCRLIVTSRTYQQSSSLTAGQIAAGQTYEADPDNRWLGRQSRFRLDAELVRDNALAISGLLVDTIGGPSARPYQPPGYYANLNFPVREYEPHADANQWRRGVYMHWQRTYLHPMLLAFDAPGRDECTANRDRSNTPLQALVLLNDPTFLEAARAFATRLLHEGGPDPASRLAWAFQSATGRTPTPDESAVLLPLVEKSHAAFAADPAAATAFLKIGLQPPDSTLAPADLAAWTTVARAILNLHATVTRS